MERARYFAGYNTVSLYFPTIKAGQQSFALPRCYRDEDSDLQNPIPVMHEFLLVCIRCAEPQGTLPRMPYHFYRNLLKDQPECIHRDHAVFPFQDHILEQVKHIVGIGTDQKIHLVLPEVFM